MALNWDRRAERFRRQRARGHGHGATQAVARAAPTDGHYGLVADALIKGNVVPFFGAGVNLCDRATGAMRRPNQDLPSGSELARYLFEAAVPPGTHVRGLDKRDLVRVSQYVSVMSGDGPLYQGLRALFDVNYEVTSLHRFFAELPSMLRSHNRMVRYPLIMTTNYDDVMERAYADVHEPFDTVTYIAEGNNRGKFNHHNSDGEECLIEDPNNVDIELDEERKFKRPVILKIHGAVDRRPDGRDSYVITEDDYIDYLAHANPIPKRLMEKLARSHFLFMGYGLRDWNLRVIMHRIWEHQDVKWKWWAIQLGASEMDVQFWNRHGVEILDQNLSAYTAKLRQRVLGMLNAGRIR